VYTGRPERTAVPLQTAIFATAEVVSPFRHLHLGDESISEAAEGWALGICIQLASRE
jgi:hypothetical protein